MQLSEILSLDCTKSAVHCTSKKRALEMISQIVAEHTGQDSTELFECMLNREKMGSTGIGNGIAIPHARMQSSDKAIAVLLQCDEAIEFDAIDNRPVDLFVCTPCTRRTVQRAPQDSILYGRTSERQASTEIATQCSE